MGLPLRGGIRNWRVLFSGHKKPSSILVGSSFSSGGRGETDISKREGVLLHTKSGDFKEGGLAFPGKRYTD